MTDKKTIRDGAAVTENEAVERMAAEIHDATGTRFSRCWSELDEGERAPWRRAARAALTSHPAVEALRELIEAHDALQATPNHEESKALHFAEDQYEAADNHARSVLESLPKEK